MSDEHPSAPIRITNQQIYDLLLRTNQQVSSVEQTVREVVQPRLVAHETRLSAKADLRRLEVLEALVALKSDEKNLERVEARLHQVELRLYGIIAGLLAAGGIGRAIGIL